MQDQFRLLYTKQTKWAILNEARDLFHYKHSQLHTHYKKFATNEQWLQNKPSDLMKEEWEFLVENFSSPNFVVLYAYFSPMLITLFYYKIFIR